MRIKYIKLQREERTFFTPLNDQTRQQANTHNFTFTHIYTRTHINGKTLLICNAHKFRIQYGIQRNLRNMNQKKNLPGVFVFIIRTCFHFTIYRCLLLAPDCFCWNFTTSHNNINGHIRLTLNTCKSVKLSSRFETTWLNCEKCTRKNPWYTSLSNCANVTGPCILYSFFFSLCLSCINSSAPHGLLNNYCDSKPSIHVQLKTTVSKRECIFLKQILSFQVKLSGEEETQN